MPAQGRQGQRPGARPRRLAAKGIELRGLLDAIVRYLPSPADEPPVLATDKAGATVEVPADENGPLLVRVFKTTADPFVGRLTYLRVLSGTLHSQAHIWNTTRDEDERIGQLLLLHGKEQEPIGELKAGEIGAVAKLTVTETGDTLAPEGEAVQAAGARLPDAVPRRGHRAGRPSRTSTRWARPSSGCSRRSPRSGSSGPPPASRSCVTMGEAHTAVIIERLKRKFGAAIATHTPKVPYKETIRGKTQVHGRYKKQTGGHGMFGDVWLELEPNPDGGVEFAERVVGGSVPKGFFAGRREGHPRGGRRGRRRRLSALRLQGDALRRLVPPGRLERAVVQDRRVDGAQGRRPPGQAGPDGADHGRRDPHPRGVHGRGQPRPQRPPRPGDGDGHRRTACRSSPPTSRRPSCSRTRRSCARWPTGRGSFTATLDHYEDVPSHIAEKVIEAHRKELEAAGHGAGH